MNILLLTTAAVLKLLLWKHSEGYYEALVYGLKTWCLMHQLPDSILCTGTHICHVQDGHKARNVELPTLGATLWLQLRQQWAENQTPSQPGDGNPTSGKRQCSYREGKARPQGIPAGCKWDPSQRGEAGLRLQAGQGTDAVCSPLREARPRHRMPPCGLGQRRHGCSADLNPSRGDVMAKADVRRLTQKQGRVPAAARHRRRREGAAEGTLLPLRRGGNRREPAARRTSQRGTSGPHIRARAPRPRYRARAPPRPIGCGLG